MEYFFYDVNYHLSVNSSDKSFSFSTNSQVKRWSRTLQKWYPTIVATLYREIFSIRGRRQHNDDSYPQTRGGYWGFVNPNDYNDVRKTAGVLLVHAYSTTKYLRALLIMIQLSSFSSSQIWSVRFNKGHAFAACFWLVSPLMLLICCLWCRRFRSLYNFSIINGDFVLSGETEGGFY